jgi:carbon-monoxide dehydrogenase small subunit
MNKCDISILVNGRRYQAHIEPRTLLISYLRDTLGLTGSHVGCVIGECGACSVLVNGELVKACLMFAVQADGATVTTVEGLESNGALHPVQEAFVREYGSQCGFCTPGMVMATVYLLKQNPNPSEEEIRKRLAGNLCMCTGYIQIVKAVQVAASLLAEQKP